MSWSSVDPRTHQVVSYAPGDNATLEAAYKANPHGNCTLVFPYGTFTVDFRSMRQVNNTGGSRSVRRQDPNAAGGMSYAGSGASGRTDSSDAAAPASAAPEGPLPDLTPEIVEAARAAVDKMDEYCTYIESQEGNAEFRTNPHSLQLPLTGLQVRAVLIVYGHIIADLNRAEMKRHYGYNYSECSPLEGHSEGQPVPAYFANVSDGQSIFYRKMVSLLGMRNLVRGGVKVFGTMQARLFIGDASAYGGHDGPHLMKYLTGNVVDLDTVVLRCSDPVQLRVINEMLRTQEGAKAPQFSSADRLAYSTFGMQMAHSQAERLISGFIERYKLSPSEVQTRCLNLPASAPRDRDEVHVATDNNNRGRAALWLYNNAGVVSYHANVPAMADVYGALLRAPFHFVKAYLIAKVRKQGTLDALKEFFEDALADTCFNQKWQSVESYLGARSREGSIHQVISQYQQSRQDVFTQEFYAEDDKKGTMELDMMLVLIASHQPPLKGVDPLTQQFRPVTPVDIRMWHKVIMSAV